MGCFVGFCLLPIAWYCLICLPQDIAHAQAPGTLFGLESQWIAGVRVTPSAQIGLPADWAQLRPAYFYP